MKRTKLFVAAPLAFGLAAQGAILKVGPGQIYQKPCQALAAAAAGDLIEIDARGDYAGDVCAFSKHNLTIRGVGGWARLDAAGKIALDKAIWVVGGNNNVIENIEFTGAVSVNKNGSGIRFEGTNLTVRNCHFHHNQSGILGWSGGGGDILIEHSLFGDNGAGDGQSHNIYIGNAASFTLRYSYSKAAVGGQLVKSRARVNYILYNRLSSETAASSYQIDISNGGTTYVIGNLLQQGPNEANNTFIAYGREGASANNPGHDLYVVNNTFVNDYGTGRFIVMGSEMTTPAVVKNNIFAGPGVLVTAPAAPVLANNLVGVDPRFVNRAGYDYRLNSDSPAINTGAAPGSAGGFALTPLAQYIHKACYQHRQSVGVIDIGAYEYGNPAARVVCARPPSGF